MMALTPNRHSELSRLVRSTSVALALSTTVLASNLVVAADFTQRVYVNGGVGASTLEPRSPSVALRVSDDSDTGVHLGVGYDLSRMLSVEAYAADLGSSEIEFLGDAVGSVAYQVYGISALGYLFNSQSGLSLFDSDESGLFRREGLSVFGRVGVGHVINKAKNVQYYRDYPSHASFGVGLEYGFQNGIALRSELMSFDTDAQYLNVGVLKRFGNVPIAAAAAIPAIPVVQQKMAALPTIEPKPAAEQPVLIVPPYIYFEYDKSDLSDEARQKLDGFIEAMGSSRQELVVGGHTDWIAPEAYNMSLSVRRAEAIANYLSGHGIDSKRMTVIGYGETRPISNNNTANGRALNRRGEIVLR